MGKFIDETGNRFGHLTVLVYIKEIGKWKCLCDCGNIAYQRGVDLRKGEAVSCGCQHGYNNLQDHTGEKFNMLTCISYDRKKRKWLCKCDCGNDTYASTNQLKRGKKKSCGCLLEKKVLAPEYINNPNYERIKNIWYCMKLRCYDKTRDAYRWYGAKGIKICDEWFDFNNFIDWALKNGYEDELQIDRIDENKDYCPKNCRWITKAENVSRASKKRWNGAKESASVK